MEVPHEAHGDWVPAAAGRAHRRHDTHVHQRHKLTDVVSVVPTCIYIHHSELYMERISKLKWQQMTFVKEPMIIDVFLNGDRV